MKPSRITRVVQILTSLQAGKGYDVSELSKIFGTSRRTIFRDLKELQAIGVPYQYNAKAGGYAIKPDFFLPPIDLNLQEALSLLLLVHKASEHVQLPFKKSAMLAALKIENNLPVKIRQYCNKTLKNISVKAVAQAPVSELDKTFTELQEAITQKHKINMLYNSFHEKGIINVELDPYRLTYRQRAWYVVGLSKQHKRVLTFKLKRIKQLQTLQECFTGGDDFDIDEYFGKAWSMIPEGRIYNIKLRFLPMVAGNVVEVYWHDTQKFMPGGEGETTAEFRVDGLGEVIWWILGYGNQVQILAPKILRERIIEIAKNIIKLNEQV